MFIIPEEEHRVFIIDIILWKAWTHIIDLPSCYNINKLENKFYQEVYNLCIKTAEETTAENLSGSEQMTKVSGLHC